MELNEIRQKVCDAGRQLLREGLVARTWGNVSMRVNDTQMMITPSGRPYDELTPNDMVLVDIYTLKYEGKIKPSSELKLLLNVNSEKLFLASLMSTRQFPCSLGCL